MTQTTSEVQSDLETGTNSMWPVKKPYTPESLAERWSCSAEKVRQMINRGELIGFRLGKLIRIPAVEVERFECASLHPMPSMSSSNIEESLQSPLGAERIVVESRLARLTLVSQE
jgi:excisionase family DNA binding protein